MSLWEFGLFIAGFMLGGTGGVILMAIMTAGKDSDNEC